MIGKIENIINVKAIPVIKPINAHFPQPFAFLGVLLKAMYKTRPINGKKKDNIFNIADG